MHTEREKISCNRLSFALHPERFTRSLTRCVKYNAKGGKSRAMFLKTVGKDLTHCYRCWLQQKRVIRLCYGSLFSTEDRLILKQVQLVEITVFIEIANEYFQHVENALKEGVSSGARGRGRERCTSVLNEVFLLLSPLSDHWSWPRSLELTALAFGTPRQGVRRNSTS